MHITFGDGCEPYAYINLNRGNCVRINGKDRMILDTDDERITSLEWSDDTQGEGVAGTEEQTQWDDVETLHVY